MTAIFEDAFYGFVSKFFLVFVVAPAAIIFAGNLLYIVIEIVRELTNNKKRKRRK